jgi:hypothetical protein
MVSYPQSLFKQFTNSPFKSIWHSALYRLNQYKYIGKRNETIKVKQHSQFLDVKDSGAKR